MAINQNHLFEELGGVKCAIVEKNVAMQRVDFLRTILEYNRYTVVVVPSPPPKAAPAAPPTPAAAPATPTNSAAPAVPAAPAPSAAPAPPAEGSDPVSTAAPAPAPETFTVGVTNVMFNPVNAIFGRLLKTPEGQIVTLAYWQQQESVPDNEKPYFDGR